MVVKLLLSLFQCYLFVFVVGCCCWLLLLWLNEEKMVDFDEVANTRPTRNPNQFNSIQFNHIPFNSDIREGRHHQFNTNQYKSNTIQYNTIQYKTLVVCVLIEGQLIWLRKKKPHAGWWLKPKIKKIQCQFFILRLLSCFFVFHVFLFVSSSFCLFFCLGQWSKC